MALLGGPSLFAQYEREEDATIPLEHFYVQRQKSGLRSLLSKLYFGLSSGYGNTAFRHKLDNFGIVQQLDSLPQIFHITNPAGRFTNWTNDVTNSTFPLAPGAFTVASDTAKIGFRRQF